MGDSKPVIFLPVINPKKLAELKEKHLKKYPDSVWAASHTWATIVVTTTAIYVVWHGDDDEPCVKIDLSSEMTKLRGISVALHESDHYCNTSAWVEFPTRDYNFSVLVTQTQIRAQLSQILGRDVLLI